MLQVVQTSLFARKKTASCINSSFTVIFLFLFSWGGVNVSVSFLFGLCLCGVDITSEKHAAKWSLYSARFSSPLTDIHQLFLFFWAELKRKGDIDFHQQRVNWVVRTQKSKAQPLSSKTRLRPLDSLDLRESFVNQISFNWSLLPRYNLNQPLSFLCSLCTKFTFLLILDEAGFG